MKIHAICVIGLLVLLSGCATGPIDCDSTDRDASLLKKMNCDHSGAYANQVRRNAEELDDARAENEAFQRFYQEAVRQQQQTEATLSQRKAQDAELSRSLNSLLSQVKRRKSINAEALSQLQMLEREAKQLEHAPAGVTKAELDARRKEKLRLQQEVSRLQLSLDLS